MTDHSTPHPASKALSAILKGDQAALEVVLAEKPEWSAPWAPAVSQAIQNQNDAAWRALKTSFSNQTSLWTTAAGDVLNLVEERSSLRPTEGHQKLSTSLMLQWLPEIIENSKTTVVKTHLLQCFLKLNRPHQALSVIQSWSPEERLSVWASAGKNMAAVFRSMKTIDRMSSRQRVAALSILDIWSKEAPLEFLVGLMQRTLVTPFEGFLLAFLPDKNTKAMSELNVSHLAQSPLSAAQKEELDTIGSPGRSAAISLLQSAVKECRLDILDCVWHNWFESGARQPHDSLIGKWLVLEAATLLAADKPKLEPQNLQAVTQWVWDNAPPDAVSCAVLTLWTDQEWSALEALVLANRVDSSLITPLDLPEDASEICPHLAALSSSAQISEHTAISSIPRPNRKI